VLVRTRGVNPLRHPWSPAFFLIVDLHHRSVYDGLVAARLNDVISFRLTDADRLRMENLKATFPDQGWRHVYEWLLALPGVADAINHRIENV
jgi:hypothetical protein